MTHKLIAVLLALTTLSWAQASAPSQTPGTAQKQEATDAKTTCPCCDKMAANEHKHGAACMHQNATARDGKDAMPCCSGTHPNHASCCGKDGKSCAKGEKNAASCCDGKCGSGGEMACCAAKGDKTSKHPCCGNQCGKPGPHEHPTTGN